MLVSCLLVFHDEDAFAHTTIYSAELCRRELEKAGHQAELIITLRRANPRTRSAVEKCPYIRESDTIFISECDTGAGALNHGVTIARGDFVAVFTALDFVDVTFLVKAVRRANDTTAPTVWHPELIFTIDAERKYFFHVDQTAVQFKGTDLFDHSGWSPCVFGRRALFLEVPYIARDTERTGFGQAIWQWNCDTVAAGFIHRVVPKTVLFERRPWIKSAAADCDRQGILGPSPFFDRADLLQSHGQQEALDLDTWRPLPDWARDAMLPYGKIYAELLHEDWVASRSHFVPTFERTGRGAAYASLLRAIGDYAPTHVILVPWLKPGGFDLGMIHHVNALSALGRKVLVMSTEPTDSAWARRMDPAAKFVNFRDAVGDLPHDAQMEVLLRYLLQARMSVLHIGNSSLGWQVFRCWPKQLAAVTSVFTTLVCDDESPSGTPVGYARDFMQLLESRLVRIFCDNSAYPKKWMLELGIESERFFVLRFPTVVPERKNLTTRLGRRSVLWAGRLDRQKRPGLLLEIAKRMPDFEFHVYGIRIMNDDNSDMAGFLAAENITIHGPYDGFPSLPHENFDLFLYTSSWDGMPNVLLEATAHGLPIVAPVVGGIGDLLTTDTGYPVFETSNPDAFVAAIRQLTDDVAETEHRWMRACAFIEKNHSDSAFMASIGAIPEYLA